MKKDKLISKILNNPKDVSFNDAVKCAEWFGFKLDRVNGSHNIFIHAENENLLNLQNIKSNAKPYQIKQLIDLIEKNNLKLKV